MPKFISKPDDVAEVAIRCASCKYVYSYSEHEIAVGDFYEQEMSPRQAYIYCGHCKTVNLIKLKKSIKDRILARQQEQHVRWRNERTAWPIHN